MAGYCLHKGRTKVLSDNVPAQWEREAGVLEPPFAHVGDEEEALLAVRELALMNEQAHVDIAGEDGRVDRIEGQLDRGELRLIQSEREIGRRERPRDGDARA